MNNGSVRISERMLAVGDSLFVRQVVLSISEKIVELAAIYPEPPDDSKVFSPVESNPRAFLSELGGLVGVFMFVAGWAATKALDEFFDAKVRPILRVALSEAFGSEGERTSKKYGLSIAVHNRETRVTILIAAIGNSSPELEASEALVRPILAMAMINAEQATATGVHLYLIDNGSCNAAPIIYENIPTALEGLNRMLPARPPRMVRHGR